MAKAAFIPATLGGKLAMVPLDQDGEDMVRACQGKPSMGEFKPARNVRQHRLYFALLNEIVDSGAWHGSEFFSDDVDGLLKWNKHSQRMFDTFAMPDGRVAIEYHSISFASMPQDRFRKFFDRSVFYICRDLLCQDGWESFRDEFLARVDGQLPEQRAA